jgi:hypothetical protein
VAELAIWANGHYMDSYDEGSLDNHTWKKWRCKFELGDICEVYPDGTCTEQPSPNNKRILLIVPDLDYEVAKTIHSAWEREYETLRVVNDTDNHIYEYTITLINTSVSGKELFNLIREEFNRLPIDVSVMSKASTSIRLRLEPLLHPSVIRGEQTPLERRDEFQSRARDEIKDLMFPIARCRYKLDVMALPTAVRQQLQTDRWGTYTWAQVQPYIVDKKDLA